MVFCEVTNEKKKVVTFENLKQRIHRVVERSQEPLQGYIAMENIIFLPAFFFFLEFIYYVCFSDKKKLETGRESTYIKFIFFFVTVICLLVYLVAW